VKFKIARNVTRDVNLCPRCGIAHDLLTRVRGLMFRATLPDDEGLWISPCPSIHMFNMKFALDAVFLTKELQVTDIVENLAPGKMYVAKDNRGKPHSVVEVASGTVKRTGTKIGDVISFRDE
jgi:uncharacterized membrane protein (UPF0127 family)